MTVRDAYGDDVEPRRRRYPHMVRHEPTERCPRTDAHVVIDCGEWAD